MSELREIFIEELRDLYDAEKQLTKAIPRMAKAARDPELKQGFTQHLEQTKEQVARIEQCFEILGQRARSKPCSGMKGIIEEGKEQMEQDLPAELMDAALTGAAKRVEHYEMAGYQAVIEMAKALKESDVAALLQETLAEETETDRKLSQVGKRLMKSAVAGARQPEESPRPVARKAGAKKSATSKAKSSAGSAKGGAKSSAKASAKGGARSGGSKSGASDEEHLSHTTTDHDEIRQWAEDRGAHPACVRGTGAKGDIGMIRLDFPGFSGADSLEEISWDEFFEKFDESGLALVYQEHTAGGEKSNFNKLVSRESGSKTKSAR